MITHIFVPQGVWLPSLATALLGCRSRSCPQTRKTRVSTRSRPRSFQWPNRPSLAQEFLLLGAAVCALLPPPVRRFLLSAPEHYHPCYYYPSCLNFLLVGVKRQSPMVGSSSRRAPGLSLLCSRAAPRPPPWQRPWVPPSGPPLKQLQQLSPFCLRRERGSRAASRTRSLATATEATKATAPSSSSHLKRRMKRRMRVGRHRGCRILQAAPREVWTYCLPPPFSFHQGEK